MNLKLSALTIYLTSCFSIANAQPDADAFSQLKALNGSWVVKSDNAIMMESWTFVNDSLYEGAVEMTDLNNNVLFSENCLSEKRKNLYYT
jgi:hypothetical protein